MAMNEKVGKDHQSMDKMVIEDSKESSAALVQAFAFEDIKVGRKRAYHETEDLNLSLAENNKDLSKNKLTIAASDIEKSTMESDSKPSSSTHRENNWLESARAELDEVREENERLKKHLSKMMKDYETLQMQFNQVMKQEETKKSKEDSEEIETVPDELVSLSLGRFSSSTTESKKDVNKYKINWTQERKYEGEKCNKRELSLGLECKFEASESDANEANRSPVNSFGEGNKEEAGDTWTPKNSLKPVQNGEDEVVQPNPLKKARVCVRARCDTPTMNDGCQWRKYGQKIAKGNPCPRAYYRCTVAASCPVRKQVQRCAEDMSILISTYEGAHNHPLPLSATAMATTTSAAASMLLSNSSTSRSNGLNPSAIIQTTPADLHTLHFHPSHNSNSKPQFYFHNSPLSPSPSHPTITLDLTGNNSAPNSSHFNRFSSPSYSSIPKFASSSINFGSGTPTQPNWGNGLFGYGNTPYKVGPINIGRSPIENNIKKTTVVPYQQESSSSIAAATKAITAGPGFQSALAVALSSIIGSGGDTLKWGEHFPAVSGGPRPTGYLNKTTADLQSGSLMLLPTSLPFSSPKSNASSSPDDGKELNS